MSKSRTGLADSRRRWSTRSAMDADGVPLLLLTLSAIDSVGMTVGCLRMDVGDVIASEVVTMMILMGHPLLGLSIVLLSLVCLYWMTANERI